MNTARTAPFHGNPRILIVDNDPLSIETLQCSLNPDYRILSASDGHEAIEIISREFPDVVILDVMVSGDGYNVCKQLKAYGVGSPIPVVMTASIWDHVGYIKGIDAGADDFITKPVDEIKLKMRIRSLLHANDTHNSIFKECANLHNFFDIISALVLAVDSKHNIMFVNKKGLDILGYEKESELLGKNCLMALIPEASRSIMEPHLDHLLDNYESNGNYYECPVLTKEKEQLLFSWQSRSLSDESGHVTGILFSGQDITEHKKVEDYLEEQVSAIESSIDGVAMMDDQGVYTFVNSAYARIFGYGSSSELIGSKWDILYNDNEFNRISNEILPEFRLKGKWEGELLGKKKDGSLFFQEVSLANLNKGIVSVCRDISKRKEAECQLKLYATQLKKSNETKALFADILCHDLLNPAHVVKGFSDILLKNETDRDKKVKLEFINKSISHLIGMVQSAAMFAKLGDIEEIEFKVMDLSSVIRKAAQNFDFQLGEKNICIDLKLDKPLPAIVNPLIGGVFSNFISNAIKYGPADSVVTITVEELEDEWKVLVSDLGEGIPDDSKQLVFDRFKRLKQRPSGIKGTGLGLAIAKKTVELHGGKIGVDDNPSGRGSSFWATVKKA